MSWPYLKAAGELRLPMPQKITALGLGNYADSAGVVTVGNALLRKWTGASEQTVRRAVRALVQRELVRLAAAGFAGDASTYQLHYPGASLVGGAGLVGPVDVEGGAKRASREVPVWQPNDRSLIPSNKSRKASRRREVPTPAQIKKLVHLLVEDPYIQFEDDGDLVESVKRACAQAGFEYDSERVISAINQVLVTRGRQPIYQSRRG